MATKASHTIRKQYTLGGLDLVTPLNIADPNKARSMSNVTPHDRGGVATRQGEKLAMGAAALGLDVQAARFGLGGICLHRRIDNTTQQAVTELLALGDSAQNTGTTAGTFWRMGTATLTIAYTDAGNPGGSAVISVLPGATYWQSVVTVLDAVGGLVSSNTFSLGDISSFVTLAAWKTAVETALPTISITIPKAGATAFSSGAAVESCAASAFDIHEIISIAESASTTLSYRYMDNLWYSGNCYDLNELSGILYANKYDKTGYNIASINYKNCTYMMNGYILLKYDGGAVTTVGLQAPTGITGAESSAGAGNIATGTYRYLVTFEKKDYQGNIVESDGFETANIAVASGPSKITLSGIPGQYGWRPIADAMAEGGVFANAGTQTGTTLTVDNGAGASASIGVGHYIYFKDHSGAEQYRLITAIAGDLSSITISGSNVTVDNNAPFSTVKINIYRTKIGPSAYYYFVGSAAVDITSDTQTYIDNTADASLTVEYTTPLTSHAPYPAVYEIPGADAWPVKALGLYQGLMLVGGTKDNQTQILFSDIDSPEYFPPENVLSVNIGDNDPITAFATAENYFLAFKDFSTYYISGNLVTGDAQVSLLDGTAGCSSHMSIARGNEGYIYWASAGGVYRSRNGGLPELISQDIQCLFVGQRSDPEAVAAFNYERAVGAYDSARRLYILYLPVLSATGANRFPIVGTRCFAYAVDSQQWYEWRTQVGTTSGVNFLGGIVFDDDDMYSADAVGSGSSVALAVVNKRINRADGWDYYDNLTPVAFSYQSHADNLGEEPSVLKHPVRARVQSLPNDAITDTAFLTFTTQKDYTNTNHTSADLSFTANEREKTIRLKPSKVRALSWKIDSSSLPLVITGVETEWAVPYRSTFKEPGS